MFLVYGYVQDNLNGLRFTDVDYDVFSDAAEHAWNYESPYLRTTYRYTPLLSWLLVGNQTCTPFFGKIVFCIFDIVCVYLIARIVDRKYQNFAAAIWGLNPFVAAISARGSAEGILAAIALALVYFWQNGKHLWAAVMLGFGAHFKIYPVIYAVPTWFALPSFRERLKFAAAAALTFFLLNLTFYAVYGFEFLEHTYLFHLSRRDYRHNFSVWFYFNYLSYKSIIADWYALLAFSPQLILVFLSGLRLKSNLPLAMFAQTFVFVIFNKVSTSQYFIWYLCFLPVLLPSSRLMMKPQWGIFLVGLWVLSQVKYITFTGSEPT